MRLEDFDPDDLAAMADILRRNPGWSMTIFDKRLTPRAYALVRKLESSGTIGTQDEVDLIVGTLWLIAGGRPETRQFHDYREDE